MMSMALWKKMLLKSDQFRFSPGEFYFRACALQICDNAKDCTSRSVRRFFFFLKFNPEVLLLLTILSMRIWSSQGKFCLCEHVPIRGLIFDVDCHVVKFLQLKLKIILWVMFSSALLLLKLCFDCVKHDCFLDS